MGARVKQVSLTALMDEMAATLRTAFAAATDVTVQVEPRMNFNPTPPSVDVYPGDPFGFDEAAAFTDDGGEIVFTVRARVSTADTAAGQELLLAMMDITDDLSVAAALQDDQTLNGHAGSVYVQGPSGYVQFIDAGHQGSLLGCTWSVTVIRAFS